MFYKPYFYVLVDAYHIGIYTYSYMVFLSFRNEKNFQITDDKLAGKKFICTLVQEVFLC
jgi:hypothetical protein